MITIIKSNEYIFLDHTVACTSINSDWVNTYSHSSSYFSFVYKVLLRRLLRCLDLPYIITALGVGRDGLTAAEKNYEIWEIFE